MQIYLFDEVTPFFCLGLNWIEMQNQFLTALLKCECNDVSRLGELPDYLCCLSTYISNSQPVLSSECVIVWLLFQVVQVVLSVTVGSASDGNSQLAIDGTLADRFD